LEATIPAGNDITNLIRFIRMDIGDDDTTQTYTDTQLITTVSKSTLRVDYDLGVGLSQATSGGYIQFAQSLSGTSTSTFLASGAFYVSSGIVTSTIPNQLFNLILLKSECILAKRSHFDSAGKAIRVRDGDTEIDTSVGFGGLQQLTAGEGGPCAEYDKALAGYLKWLQAQLEGDITDYAAIIWKGSTRKTASHVEVGIDGEQKTEIMADFSDYLDGSTGHSSTNQPNNRLGPDRNL
jgi:hypothetical protein